MVTDETLFAWLDGELDNETSARVAAEIAADRVLTERVAQHRAMQAKLKGAFNGLLDAPVPKRLAEAARKNESKVIDFAAAKGSHGVRAWASLPQWASLAATLAIGIFAGTMVPRSTNAPIEVQGGKVYAAAALDNALDTQLASTPRGSVRIELTFRDRSAAICRSFTETAASGLACRDGDRWQVRGLFTAPEGQSGPYRMASGMDPNLATMIDSTIIGEPFSADQERSAQARRWH